MGCLDWGGEENQGNQGMERVWEVLEWSWALGELTGDFG